MRWLINAIWRRRIAFGSDALAHAYGEKTEIKIIAMEKEKLAIAYLNARSQMLLVLSSLSASLIIAINNVMSADVVLLPAAEIFAEAF